MSLIPHVRPQRRFPLGGEFDFNDPKALQFLHQMQMQNRGDPRSGLFMDQAFRGYFCFSDKRLTTQNGDADGTSNTLSGGRCTRNAIAI